MGLGEMMGVKNVKLELKGNYDTLTDDWSSMSGAFGNKKKRCMELVDITANEIKAAGI